MSFNKDNFIKIRPGVYLSKSDPSYWRKYLQFFPTNPEANFEFGLELNNKGPKLDGLKYIEYAEEKGYYRAKKYMKKYREEINKKGLNNNKKKGKGNYLSGFLIGLSIAFVLVLLLTVAILFTNYFTQDNNLYKENQYVHSYKETTDYQHTVTSGIEKNNLLTEGKDLPYLVLKTAVEGYAKLEGDYPLNKNELLGSYPKNYMTYIHNLPDYERIEGGYQLKGSNNVLPTGILSVGIYLESGKLTIERGDEVLAVYPIAYGEDSIEIGNTLVYGRVVNPNGGDGIYGTRGLVLHDNLAIHGTDKPESIGKEVSEGCIRLENSTIEEIYPYIPMGTEVTLKPGLPSEPTFPDGLPVLDRTANGEGADVNVGLATAPSSIGEDFSTTGVGEGSGVGNGVGPVGSGPSGSGPSGSGPIDSTPSEETSTQFSWRK